MRLQDTTLILAFANDNYRNIDSLDDVEIATEYLIDATTENNGWHRYYTASEYLDNFDHSDREYLLEYADLGEADAAVREHDADFGPDACSLYKANRDRDLV